jgi:hypothetical protein
VALSPEVLASVVNAGDLSGAATVTFFDWAVSSKPPPSVDTCNYCQGIGEEKIL